MTNYSRLLAQISFIIPVYEKYNISSLYFFSFLHTRLIYSPDSLIYLNFLNPCCGFILEGLRYI